MAHQGEIPTSIPISSESTKRQDVLAPCEEGPLLPPISKRMPGRPTKKRRREPLEKKSNTKISRFGRIFKCGICGVQGHNKLTCQKKPNRVNIFYY